MPPVIEESAAALIARLALAPHPEGGHYRETVRLPAAPGERSAMTAILFLLDAGERSHWHRVDAAELWLWHAGTPLTLRIEGQDAILLGADVATGEQPQALVPAHAWQSAEAGSGWALTRCVVAPGFDFAGFELALPDWEPQPRASLTPRSRGVSRPRSAARSRRRARSW